MAAPAHTSGSGLFRWVAKSEIELRDEHNQGIGTGSDMPTIPACDSETLVGMGVQGAGKWQPAPQRRRPAKLLLAADLQGPTQLAPSASQVAGPRQPLLHSMHLAHSVAGRQGEGLLASNTARRAVAAHRDPLVRSSPQHCSAIIHQLN